jgi:hypothetical protein
VISARPPPLAGLAKVTVAAVKEVLFADLLATELTPLFFFLAFEIVFWFAIHGSPLSNHH